MRIMTLVCARVLVAAACLCPSLAVSGQNYLDDVELKRVKRVQIIVSDDVQDGCLPRPSTLSTEAELILRRSGIEIKAREEGGGLATGEYTLQIALLGYAAEIGGRQAGCVVSLLVELWTFEVIEPGRMPSITAYSTHVILTGPKSKMQEYLRETVNERATDLANEILKARQ